ncbi:MAG: hypothetical protein ACKVY0_23865 [Prosthecobacter sp.]|uniref:hypothetical protein n=1 Tax=Prosthecobacter sp. TaxID=1965333 RepID=UPI003902074F
MKSKDDELRFPWGDLFWLMLIVGYLIKDAIRQGDLDPKADYYNTGYFIMAIAMLVATVATLALWASKVIKKIRAMEQEIEKLKRPEE